LKLEFRANDFKFDPKDHLTQAIDLLDEAKGFLRRQKTCNGG
jgi:hypothetical protein